MPHVARMNRELKATKEKTVFLLPKVVQLAQLMSIGNHSKVREIARQLIEQGKPIGYFYEAQSDFLTANYSDAKQRIDLFLSYYPYHPDGVYLQAQILEEIDELGSAWSVLDNLALSSTRLKTWMYLSNLVKDDFDLAYFNRRLDSAYQFGKVDKQSFDIVRYRSNAGLRAKNTDFVLELWRKYKKEKNSSAKLKRKVVLFSAYTSDIASQALKDLKRILDSANIEFFLVGGTLLGCVREHALLAHDKDIDIGVWADVDFDFLRSQIAQSGLFYFVPSRAPRKLMTLKHVNGISIDVFFHVKEKDNYWHASVKLKWSNSPFVLMPQFFLGEHYLIPQNYDLYLTEHYGQWRYPVRDYDCSIDTKNLEIYDEVEMAAYAYKKIIELKGERKAERYFQLLKNYGEIV
ncbi:MAG: hypothetical protein LWW76_00010 [Burkholderiales bacterium]|nr:hypothetical protein [Burkholderiales bacterium]